MSNVLRGSEVPRDARFQPADDQPELLEIYRAWSPRECRSAALALVLATGEMRSDPPGIRLEVPVPIDHLAFAHYVFRGLPGYLDISFPSEAEVRGFARWRVVGEGEIAKFLCDLGVWPESLTIPRSAGRLSWRIDRRFLPERDPAPSSGAAAGEESPDLPGFAES